MIPKIIHYSWFGSEKPADVEKNIESWKNELKDWQFIEWNEKNWNVNQYVFASQMYTDKNWGYIADPIRFDVLFRFGGVYLDTDMILNKSIDEFLDNTNFFGFMYTNNLHTGMIGAEKNSDLMGEILKMYKGEKYSEINELIYHATSNPVITKMLMTIYPEFVLNGKYQKLKDGTLIVPKDYFCYPSWNNNANYAEHLFMNSWGNAHDGVKGAIREFVQQYFKKEWAVISAYRGKKRAQSEGFKIIK